MNTTIFFDLDGTLADLYGVEGWLDMLIASDSLPYEIAKPLVRLSALARLLNGLQKKGYRIGVISWLSKNSTPEYEQDVTAAKEKWLAKHLGSVQFDEVKIAKYGTPKQFLADHPFGILFDDEQPNRDAWVGEAYDVHNILEVLTAIAA